MYIADILKDGLRPAYNFTDINVYIFNGLHPFKTASAVNLHKFLRI